jgi:hypothetical protein
MFVNSKLIQNGFRLQSLNGGQILMPRGIYKRKTYRPATSSPKVFTEREVEAEVRRTVADAVKVSQERITLLEKTVTDRDIELQLSADVARTEIVRAENRADKSKAELLEAEQLLLEEYRHHYLRCAARPMWCDEGWPR